MIILQYSGYVLSQIDSYSTNISKKSQKNTHKLTIHKWVLNVMTGPNPTQYTEFDTCTVKLKNRNLSKIPKM